jgi:hypothetical protein
VGKQVRMRRPNMSCTGDSPECSAAVCLQSNNANKGSPPVSLALLISRFAVLTAASARPLDCR